MNLKNSKKRPLNIINNLTKKIKIKIKALDKEEQLTEIIKVPKKRKQQIDKVAQIAAEKISKKYKNRFH